MRNIPAKYKWKRKVRFCQNCKKKIPRENEPYKFCSDECRIEFWDSKLDFMNDVILKKE